MKVNKSFKSVLLVNAPEKIRYDFRDFFPYKISLSWMKNIEQVNLIGNNNELDIILIWIKARDISDRSKIIFDTSKYLLLVYIIDGELESAEKLPLLPNVVFWPQNGSLTLLKLLIISKLSRENNNKDLCYLTYNRKLIVRGCLIKLNKWEEDFYNLLMDVGNERYVSIKKIQDIFSFQKNCIYKRETLVVYIARMRKKIKKYSNVDIIKTEYKKGYSLKSLRV